MAAAAALSKLRVSLSAWHEPALPPCAVTGLPLPACVFRSACINLHGRSAGVRSPLRSQEVEIINTMNQPAMTEAHLADLSLTAGGFLMMKVQSLWRMSTLVTCTTLVDLSKGTSALSERRLVVLLRRRLGF